MTEPIRPPERSEHAPVALITGIGGQDGYYLAHALTSAGWRVHGLDRSAEQTDLPAAVMVHEVDVTDEAATARLLRRLEPSVIYNLAGISSVAQSFLEPVATTRVCGLAAVSLMEQALELQERTGRQVRFVQASSAEIFGQATSSPQDETTPIAPVSPYGAAKGLAHLSARVQRARGLHCSSLVLYTHESPRRPERFVTRKVSRAVARIAAGDERPLAMGNLDARRDWGWAPDVVEAMVRAAAAEQPGDYVIATGVAHSVRDLLDAAFGCIGVTDWSTYVTLDPALHRPADPHEQIGDPSRARDLLGWAPSVTFEQLVARMVQHDLG